MSRQGTEYYQFLQELVQRELSNSQTKVITKWGEILSNDGGGYYTLRDLTYPDKPFRIPHVKNTLSTGLKVGEKVFITNYGLPGEYFIVDKEGSGESFSERYASIVATMTNLIGGKLFNLFTTNATCYVQCDSNYEVIDSLYNVLKYTTFFNINVDGESVDVKVKIKSVNGATSGTFPWALKTGSTTLDFTNFIPLEDNKVFFDFPNTTTFTNGTAYSVTLTIISPGVRDKDVVIKLVPKYTTIAGSVQTTYDISLSASNITQLYKYSGIEYSIPQLDADLYTVSIDGENTTTLPATGYFKAIAYIGTTPVNLYSTTGTAEGSITINTSSFATLFENSQLSFDRIEIKVYSDNAFTNLIRAEIVDIDREQTDFLRISLPSETWVECDEGKVPLSTVYVNDLPVYIESTKMKINLTCGDYTIPVTDFDNFLWSFNTSGVSLYRAQESDPYYNSDGYIVFKDLTEAEARFSISITHPLLGTTQFSGVIRRQEHAGAPTEPKMLFNNTVVVDQNGSANPQFLMIENILEKDGARVGTYIGDIQVIKYFSDEAVTEEDEWYRGVPSLKYDITDEHTSAFPKLSSIEFILYPQWSRVPVNQATIPVLHGSGADGIGVNITSETLTAIVDASGEPSTGLDLSTTLSIYKGLVNDSANWSFTSLPASSTDWTLSIVDNVFTITALNVDNSYFDIVATQGDSEITRRVTVRKQGPGESVTQRYIGVQSLTLTKDSPNAITPGAYSPLIFQAQEIVGSSLPTPYVGGWITLQDDLSTNEDVALATRFASDVVTTVNTSAGSEGVPGISSYTLKLFDQTPSELINPIDIITIPVVYKGNTGDIPDLSDINNFASSVQLTGGTVSSGTLANTQDLYVNEYVIKEAAQTPGFIVEFLFTNVDTFNQIRTNVWYEGGTTHVVKLQIYNYNTTSWTDITTVLATEALQYIEMPINDDSNYISNGNARLRFNHISAGNAAHYIHFDYVNLVHTHVGSKGDPGYTPIKGVDYFDGVDGADGTSSYLWVKYSMNADGTGFNDTPTGALYIGTAVTTTPSAPTLKTDYNWTLIKGTDGLAGEDGVDGQTSYLHIKYSDDGGTTFTGNSGEDVGIYIGTYVDFTAADSSSVSSYTWNKVKGDSGLTFSLTNESHTFTAATDGTISDYSSGISETRVMYGTEQLTTPTLVSATNMVTNGDFSDGTTGWGAENHLSFTAPGAVGTIYNGGVYSTTRLTRIFAFEINHTYYTRINNISQSGVSSFMFQHYDFTYGSKYAQSFAASSSYYSTIFRPTGSLSATSRWTFIAEFSALNTSYFYTFDNIVLIDLTTIFGPGNEPSTTAEAEAYLEGLPNNFFSGTTLLGSLSNNQYKITNITNTTGTFTLTPSSANSQYTLTPSAMTTDDATKTITIMAKVNNATTTLDKTISYSKSKTGQTGALAPMVTITPTTQTFVSSDGINFSPDTITLSLFTQNATFSTWHYSTNGGATYSLVQSGVTSGITYIGDGTLTLSKNSTLFNTSKSIALKVTAGTVTDVVTIYKISDGTDGTSTTKLSLSLPDGNTFQGNTGLSKTVNVILRNGETDVTAQASSIKWYFNGVEDTLIQGATTQEIYPVDVSGNLTIKVIATYNSVDYEDSVIFLDLDDSYQVSIIGEDKIKNSTGSVTLTANVFRGTLQIFDGFRCRWTDIGQEPAVVIYEGINTNGTLTERGVVLELTASQISDRLDLLCEVSVDTVEQQLSNTEEQFIPSYDSKAYAAAMSLALS